MNKKIILIALLVGSIAGCATAPMTVDLSGSTYKTAVKPDVALPKVASVVIINKADDGKMVNTILGSDSIFPIKPQTTTKETVERDIAQYLRETLAIDQNSTRSLQVVISKADSYCVWGGAAKIPFIGIAMVNADTEFGLNLRVLFEIEERGKVVSSYIFDDKIVIQGKAATDEVVKESYQRLIAEYRKRLFGELDTRFVRRYFE